MRNVGLPALDGRVYATGDNLLGAALVGLMRGPEADKPRVKADAMRRVAESGRSDLHRFLFMSLIEAYLPLDVPLIGQYQDLLRTKEYQPVIKMAETTFERGERMGQAKILRKLLETKFGPLTETTLQRLEASTSDELDALAVALLGESPTLANLGLVDEPSA